jgi:hypothetical protein
MSIVSAVSQDNPYANDTYFGVAYVDPHIFKINGG